MKYQWIIEVISAILIIMWAYTAFSKLLEYPVFAAQLHTHSYLKYFSTYLAWALPAAEFIVALLLIIPKTRFLGLYLTIAFLLTFTGYLVFMLLFEEDLPCSCGGFVSSLTWGQHIAFNVFLVLLAFLGVRLHNTRNCQDKSFFAKILSTLHQSPP